MILIAIIIGCLIGALIGMYAPMVSYTYSGYLAIAIIAALDSVFGGIVATLKKNLAIIRRYYIDIVVKKIEDKKSKKDNLKEEKTE